MSEKPISPRRQRMLDGMSVRRFTPDTQRQYIRAVKSSIYSRLRRRSAKPSASRSTSSPAAGASGSHNIPTASSAGVILWYHR